MTTKPETPDEILLDVLRWLGWIFHDWQPVDNGYFLCSKCGHLEYVNFSTWNEEHGNGFKGKVKA